MNQSIEETAGEEMWVGKIVIADTGVGYSLYHDVGKIRTRPIATATIKETGAQRYVVTSYIYGTTRLLTTHPSQQEKIMLKKSGMIPLRKQEQVPENQ